MQKYIDEAYLSQLFNLPQKSLFKNCWINLWCGLWFDRWIYE